MKFENLDIIEPILKALNIKKYTTPTPIQQKAIPYILKKQDVLGCAQTGTGKTAAFAIPIIQNLFNEKTNNSKAVIKSLIVTPTRELAIQIAENFTDYGKFTGIRNTVIFGGVKQGSQVRAIKNGVEVLIATPGRLLDLIEQGYVNIKQVKYFVLDEADRMLDMGFINDIKRIIKILPNDRQSLFFSATMPNNIVALSNTILKNPKKK
jgi:ATP-dependent RNA helicase RhlE